MDKSLTALIIVADSALLTSALFQVARIKRATAYLCERRRFPTGGKPAPFLERSPTVVVLVPMWREQGTVPSAIARFTDLVAGCPWARVLFLANDDDSDPSRGLVRSTFEVLTNELLHSRAENVDVHLTEATTKADKLRAAMATREVVEADVVAVYDADSAPDSSTLELAVERLRDRLDRSVVLQQTSLHLSSSNAHWLKDAAGSSALRQTRWSLHFELGRLLPPPKAFPRWPQPLRRFRYIVGHGVFFTASAVRLALPLQGLIIEDSYMSLALKEAGLLTGPTSIEPLPGLDASALPPTMGGILDQKARWYTGPRDAFDYYRPIAQRIPQAQRIARLRLLVEAAKLRMHAVYWIAGPILYLAIAPALLIGLRHRELLCLHALVVTLHAWGVDVVAARAARRLGLQRGLRLPLPHLSLAIWALWGMCALPGFTSYRRWRTQAATPSRAERTWEQPAVVEGLA